MNDCTIFIWAEEAAARSSSAASQPRLLRRLVGKINHLFRRVFENEQIMWVKNSLGLCALGAARTVNDTG